MPEPCEFSSLDSRQKRFRWAHKEVDLAPHPVVDLVLQAANAKKLKTLHDNSTSLPQTKPHTHTHARTHTRADRQTHTHTHTHAHIHTLTHTEDNADYIAEKD